MKRKLVNVLTVILTMPILFLVLAFHVDANGFSDLKGQHQYACKGGRVVNNGECAAVAGTEENTIYIDDCLHCANWGANYDGCGSYLTKRYEYPLSHTTLSQLHQQCKNPVIYYRTTKGYPTIMPKNDKERGTGISNPSIKGARFREVYDNAIFSKNNDKYVSYNRCNTILEKSHAHCQFIYGDACVACASKHCCDWDDAGNCTQECNDHRCTGVGSDGSPKDLGCQQVDGCGDCRKLKDDQAFMEENELIGIVTLDWIAGSMPGGTVNAACDITYGIEYDVDICTSNKVKTSNYVCQKEYSMYIDGNRVDAYCINPEMGTAGKVAIDDTFDVTTCDTSLSTINCGFANILIEGYLRKEIGKYNNKDYYSIISQALQLWGAHVNERGYNGAGMSPESVAYAMYKPGIPGFPEPRCSNSVEKYKGISDFGILVDITDFDDYNNPYFTDYGEFMYYGVDEHTGNRLYKNIFKETGDNFDKYLSGVNSIYEVTSNVTDIKVVDGKLTGNVNESGLTGVNCNNLKTDNKLLMGLCTQTQSDNKYSSHGNTDYLEVLYLFASTIQGNRNMVDHLFELIAYKDTDASVTVDSLRAVNNPVEIDTTVADDSNILVTYRIANQGKNMVCADDATDSSGTPICCSRGDKKGNTELCQVDQNSITIEGGGKTRVITNGVRSYDYCTLNGYCYLKVGVSGFSRDELCDARATFDINMEVLSSKSALKRYEPEGSETDRQSYFVLDYSHDPQNTERRNYSTTVSCPGCTESATVRTGYVITSEQAVAAGKSTPKEACTSDGANKNAYYDEETNICYALVDNGNINEGIRSTHCINCIVDSNGQCIKNDEKIVMVDESINSRRISDPSLNCIVNMSYNAAENRSKSYYDYSEAYGVNTDVCKIYCSDEVNVFLANKKDVYVGMHLKYDIESLVEQAYGLTAKTNRNAVFNPDNNKQYNTHGGKDGLMLSAIVMQERKCVSKIFFKQSYDSFSDWVTKYNLPSGSVISNWQDLYRALNTKSGSENLRRENLNQLLYDLYNCNLMNPQEIKDASNSVVYKPVDRNNVYKYIIDMYKSVENENVNENEKVVFGHNIPKVQIQDHRCGNGPCAELETAEYTGGAQYIPEFILGEKPRVGEKTGEPEISYYTTSNVDINNPNDPDHNYDPNSEGYKPMTVLYCDKGECFNGVDSLGNYGEDYLKFHEQNNETISTVFANDGISNFKGVNVKIPTNDYAIFTIQIRTDFYNSDIYQTEYYTGKVKQYEESLNKTYVKLDKYIYPVSIDAFQDRNCFEKDENGIEEKGRCKTTFAFNIRPDSTRKSNNDRFAKYLKNTDFKATEYTCNYVSRSEVIREGIVYRSIGLDNPFPNIGARPTATNWMTPIGTAAINEIKSSAESINKVSDQYLEYKYIITKKGLENIRDEYNYSKDTSGAGYSDKDTIFGCLKADETYRYTVDYKSKDDGVIYVQCKSSFLQDLNDNKFEGVTPIKGDGISKYSQENRVNAKVAQEGSGE